MVAAVEGVEGVEPFPYSFSCAHVWREIGKRSTPSTPSTARALGLLCDAAALLSATTGERHHGVFDPNDSSARGAKPRTRQGSSSHMTKRIISVDVRGADRFAKDLQTFAQKAVPHAMRNTLNSAAFEVRGKYVAEAKSKLTLRNTFTARSIRVDKATGNRPHMMEARVGSTAPYMDDVEQGVTETSKGKHGLPIPTTFAAGQSAGKRTRAVRRGNYLSAIKLNSKPVSGSPKRKNAAALRMAKESGGGFAFLNTGKFKGVFKVDAVAQGKRQHGPVRESGAFRFKLKPIYDLSHKTATTRALPLLEGAVIEVKRVMPVLITKAVLEQLKRNKVFGY